MQADLMRTHVAALERQLNDTLDELSTLEARMDRMVDREEQSPSPPSTSPTHDHPSAAAVVTSAEMLQAELDRDRRDTECLLPEGGDTGTPKAAYTFKRSKEATRRPSQGGRAPTAPPHSTA